MAQPREMFHPSSPPSEGGADSYNHEGTPDTRLTAFSPLEDSSKSSRLLSTVNLSGSKANAEPIKFQVPTGFHQITSPNSYSPDSQEDKDPFISSTHSKPQTKLSATASAFRPLAASASSTPVVAHGSTSATPKPPARSSADAKCTKSGLKLASGLSHNLHLTHSLRISSSDALTTAAAEQYLKVSRSGCGIEEKEKHFLTCFQEMEGHGRPFRGDLKPYLARNRKDVYIRAANIRDAARVLDFSNDAPKNWNIECVSAEEISNVCSPPASCAHKY